MAEGAASDTPPPRTGGEAGRRPNRAALAVVLATAAVSVALLVLYASGVEGGRDDAGLIYGRDFVNLHLAGRIIAEDRLPVLFDNAAYMEALRAWLGPGYSVHHWSYPPSLLWLAEGFGRLPYPVALLIWTLAGAGLLILALRVCGVPAWLGALACLSPAGLLNILAGQNGFLTAALFLLAVLATVASRPLGAGLAWAALTMKPHLGVVVLPWLLASRRWGAIGAGTLFLAVLVGATIWRYGTEPWVLFVTETMPFQRRVLEEWQDVLTYLVPTLFMQGRLLGFPTEVAYALHAGGVALAVWLLVHGWPRRDDLRDTLTWIALGTFAILPYSFVYDLVLLQAVLLLWIHEPEKLFGTRQVARGAALWCLAWVLPFASALIAASVNLQVAPFFLLLMLWCRARAARRERRGGVGSAG
ncbi:glycosyltransferase family 87 protein [Roseicyclus sp.]|uniref:glycosyltransferase family 87 protein n=1 Tax=Roseicyclus sp. TaxID=1914329 RepID=UPI003FA0001F